MNSCHKQGVRDRNRAGIMECWRWEAGLMWVMRGVARDVWKTKGHLKVWKGCGVAVSNEMLSHGMGGGCIRHLAGSRNVKWVTSSACVQSLFGLVPPFRSSTGISHACSGLDTHGLIRIATLQRRPG
eukprot:gene12879-biopygen3494